MCPLSLSLFPKLSVYRPVSQILLSFFFLSQSTTTGCVCVCLYVSPGFHTGWQKRRVAVLQSHRASLRHFLPVSFISFCGLLLQAAPFSSSGNALKNPRHLTNNLTKSFMHMQIFLNEHTKTDKGWIQAVYLTMALPPVRPRDFRVAFFSASSPLTYTHRHTHGQAAVLP